MRRLLSYIGIFSGLGLLVVSTSRPLMKNIGDWRYAHYGPMGVHHTPDGGDLVTMAYLDDEPKFCEPFGYTFVRRDTGAVDLYVFGDSYVMYLPDTAFANVHRYTFGRRDYTDINYTLNPHRRNILIIENAERFIRMIGAQRGIYQHVRKAGADIELFNSAINQNLEFNLFSYNFITPVRKLKADLTYRCWARASGDAHVSEDGEYLFLASTLSPRGPQSSYEPVPAAELSLIETGMDSVYRHYRQEGFDEVYFSIIPNPASILQPKGYNGLIPALQAHGLPCIDVYGAFKASSHAGELYRRGDTHWNDNGMHVWLNLVNSVLQACPPK